MTSLPTDCVEWDGRINASGYGTIGSRLAHRVAYEQEVGPIPKGLEIDHLCNNPTCVNVEHLEPVTHEENVRRSVERGTHISHVHAGKTHCPQGHPYAEHGRRGSNGKRYCRTCKTVLSRTWRRQSRLAAAS